MTSIACFVFEGGREEPVGDADRFFARLRDAAVLDLLAEALRVPALDPVVLCSDEPALLAEAERLGALAWPAPRPFGLGLALRDLVARLRPTAALVMGGGAGPLLTADDLAAWAERLRAGRDLFLVNNPMSPDIVGVRPAGVLRELPDRVRDNELVWALRAVGLRRELLPNEPRINLDLDTPTDAAVLALGPGGGPRTRAVLAELPWTGALERLRQALERLLRPGAEVLLAGRVSPVLVGFLNAHLPLRTRVLSEERGMKALGREERGQVRSLLAAWVEQAGVEAVFAALESCCDAAFIDTRPLFAHAGRRVPTADRFASDRGEWQAVQDPLARAFTRRAVEAAIPVVLGGHALVYGGLWYLVSSRLAREAAPRLQQETLAGR